MIEIKSRREKQWRLISIEPFIRGIELRQADDQHTHLTDGPVPDTRWNHDGDPRFQRDDVVVEFHYRVGSTLKNVICLGVFTVIMRFCIAADRGDVQRAGKVGNLGEGPAGRTAGAGDSGNRREVGEGVTRNRHENHETHQARRLQGAGLKTSVDGLRSCYAMMSSTIRP